MGKKENKMASENEETFKIINQIFEEHHNTFRNILDQLDLMRDTLKTIQIDMDKIKKYQTRLDIEAIKQH